MKRETALNIMKAYCKHKGIVIEGLRLSDDTGVVEQGQGSVCSDEYNYNILTERGRHDFAESVIRSSLHDIDVLYLMKHIADPAKRKMFQSSEEYIAQSIETIQREDGYEGNNIILALLGNRVNDLVDQLIKEDGYAHWISSGIDGEVDEFEDEFEYNNQKYYIYRNG